MNLVADVGNSFAKLAVFEGENLITLERVPHEGFLQGVEKLFLQYPDIRQSIISAVGRINPNDLIALQVFAPVHVLARESRVPFINDYQTPQTLGVDRMALVTAAYSRYPQQNCLVIDAGTCITYDLLTSNGHYPGGAISPGLEMRFKALNHFTEKLPLVEDREFDGLVGISTNTSIISGVVNGMVNEIDGIIEEYSKACKDLTVILTGGDCLFLSKRLKSNIFAHSNFLLEGLNYILELNKHND